LQSDGSHKKDKVYFISDFHLGVPNHEISLHREKQVVQWLNQIKNDASDIYFMGDVFDFWFEYKYVVPKGYVRLLGKIAEMADSGIKIHYFTGNHDMWCFDYFEKELGAQMYHKPVKKIFHNKVFYLGHGDGLGPGDSGYKVLKKIFRNPVCQWMFSIIHPDIGIGIANYFSKKSRLANSVADEKYLGEENEWLISYSKDCLKEDPTIDYFIFGHRHLPLDVQLNEKSRYINLGEWINHNSYAVFDGESLKLEYFNSYPRPNNE
jgi:UDP-2,3-diacylglucosamine hydrolase